MTNAIAPIFDNENGEVRISGRQLHMFLEVQTPYAKWFDRMTEYGFTEGADFWTNLSKTSSELGGRPATDHLMTLSMAKELAMLQRTEKGKEARRYFIRIEEEWNTPERVMARALRFSEQILSDTKALLADAQEQILFA